MEPPIGAQIQDIDTGKLMMQIEKESRIQARSVLVQGMAEPCHNICFGPNWGKWGNKGDQDIVEHDKALLCADWCYSKYIAAHNVVYRVVFEAERQKGDVEYYKP